MTNFTAERTVTTGRENPRTRVLPRTDRPGARPRPAGATMPPKSPPAARKTAPARTALRPATVCQQHRHPLSPRLSILPERAAGVGAWETKLNRAAFLVLAACAAGMGLACYSALGALVTRGAMFVGG